MSQLTSLCSTSEVSEDAPIECEVDQLSLVIGMADGKYFAVENLCPHAWAPIGTYQDGRMLACPWHGLRFDVHTGVCESWSDLDRLQRYPIQIQDDVIYLVSAEPMSDAAAD